MLTGPNGLLTQANDAKVTTEQADAEEQVKVAVLASYDNNGNLDYGELKKNLDKIPKIERVPDEITKEKFPIKVKVNGYDVTIEDDGNVKGNKQVTPSTGDKPGKPDGDGIFTESSTIDGKTRPEETPDAASKNPMIPAGFKPLDTDTSKWGNGKSAPTEADVNNGLVITDGVDEEGNSIGNEFVWVPVPNFDNFIRIEGYCNGSLQSRLTNCGEADAGGNNSQLTETPETKAEAIAMYDSVEKYGGFYIGRYEAGNDRDGNTIVKKDVNPYSNIGWSSSDTMSVDTGGAVEKARKMKNGKKWEGTATSTLIYGVQWDATMQFFDSKYKDGIPEKDIQNSYVANSTGRGNYNEEANKKDWKGSITTTGALPAYAEKNIYDMAGNAWEWTMETYDSNYRVIRGGAYDSTGSNGPTSDRSYNYPSYSGGNYNFLGFRVTLYVR